jgi:hypothetical protein
LGSYIVDFYCATAHLVIEIDGSQHYEPEHQQADRLRDEYLTGLGLRVLRFDNRQVLLEIEAVVEFISKIPPAPLFQRGGRFPIAYQSSFPIASESCLPLGRWLFAANQSNSPL